MCGDVIITAIALPHVHRRVAQHSTNHATTNDKCEVTHFTPHTVHHVLSEMEPGLRITGHRVSDFGRVGSGHGSVCQTRCLTRLWVLTCAFIVALFLQSNTSRQTNVCMISCRLRKSTDSDNLLMLGNCLGNWYCGKPLSRICLTTGSGRVGLQVKNTDPVPFLRTVAKYVRLS